VITACRAGAIDPKPNLEYNSIHPYLTTINLIPLSSIIIKGRAQEIFIVTAFRKQFILKKYETAIEQ